MPASEAEFEAQWAAHVQSFYSICHMIEKLEDTETPTLSKDLLRDLKIDVLDALDVDMTSTHSSKSQFFAPAAPAEVQPATQQLPDYEWSVEDPYPDVPLSYQGTLNQFHSLDDVLSDITTSWRRVPLKGKFDLPRYCNERYAEPGVSDIEGVPYYRFDAVYGMRVRVKKEDGSNPPHMMAIVIETFIPQDGEVLRSDVLTAAYLLKRQLRMPAYAHHRIIPTLIISLQAGDAARVTQIHYDGERMFIRPSRQFDFGGSKPTKDIALLLRWWCCHPIGNTTNA